MLKFYTYISKAKVDMLLPQIPLVFKTKFAAEVGINVGIFKAKVSSEIARNAKDSDVRRLELVSMFIESSDEVSDLNGSKKWIKDAFEARPLSVKQDRTLFLLVGKKYGAYHLLGGSGHHVVGDVTPSEIKVNYSYFPHLMEVLSAKLSDHGQEKIEAVRAYLAKQGRVENDLTSSMAQQEWAEVVRSLYDQSSNLILPVKFLARVQSRAETYDGVKCTISSPLYVQQT